MNKIYVEDARGMAPTLPFWVGEAPARSDELSVAVSRLRADALGKLADGGAEGLDVWLREAKQLDAVAAQQLAQYLAAGQAALGTLPTLDTIVFERFFDDVGDTHLVIHSTFGSRINRAWGFGLGRFCRQFNFELQASALEDSIVLSLGPTHSFPLEDVKEFLKSDSAEDVARAGAARRAGVRHALALGRRDRARPVRAALASACLCCSSARTPRTCWRSCSPTSSPARRT